MKSPLFTYLAATLSLALTAETAPHGSRWAVVSQADLLAAYKLFAANHPGMEDPRNRSFRAQLVAARDAGLAVGAMAHDLGGYADALGAFSSVLADGHALLAENPPAGPEQVEWPGFVAAWRGNGAYVHYASSASPAPVGSAIEQCNGQAIRNFIQSRLAYSGFRPREAGQWWSRSPRAFTASYDLMRDIPRDCTFRLPDGRSVKRSLTWSKAPANIDTLLRTASDGERTPISLSEQRQGVFVIGMPDFNPDPDGVKAWGRLYDALRERRADLLRAKAVVIDLRYNNGGSSEWSREAARLLWGTTAVDAQMDRFERGVSIWWRASSDNISYMKEMERKVRSNGQTAVADEIQLVAGGMKTAAAEGHPFYVEPGSKQPKPVNQPLAPSKFTAPVYVITPGRCASACLDAIDTFKRFPNVKLIGAPTSADSNYIEVRVAHLPSGEGNAVIPIKMWVGRPRKAGDIYRPDIELDAVEWSTANFLDRIEADLRSGADERHLT